MLIALFSVSNLIHFLLGARITSAHARTRDLLRSPLMIATALGFARAVTGLRIQGQLILFGSLPSSDSEGAAL